MRINRINEAVAGETEGRLSVEKKKQAAGSVKVLAVEEEEGCRVFVEIVGGVDEMVVAGVGAEGDSVEMSSATGD